MRINRLVFLFFSLTGLLFLYACSSSNQKININTEQSESGKSVSKSDFSKRESTGIFKIGVMLPLTGPHKDLGEALQAIVELAYFDGLSHENVQIIFADSGFYPHVSKKAMEGLVAKGANVIVGPVFSAEARAISEIANQKKIPVLSLSNDKKIASGYVFSLGSNPTDQVRQSFSYAKEIGIRTISAILPRNDYGDQIMADLRVIASENGIKIKDIRTYSPQNPYEYDSLDMNGVDAIFIPDGEPNGRKVIESLFHQGVDTSEVTFIGSSLWEGLSQRSKKFFYARTDKVASTELLHKAEFLSGRKTPAIGAILYDTLYLALMLAGLKDVPIKLETIKNPVGFKGIDGVFTITQNGYTVREMTIVSSSDIIQSQQEDVDVNANYNTKG